MVLLQCSSAIQVVATTYEMFNEVGGSLMGIMNQGYGPRIHYYEKPADNRSRDRIRIQLTCSSNQHGPCDTSEETIHIRVDGPPWHVRQRELVMQSKWLTLCPKLDTSEGVPEHGHVGYQS